MKKIFRIVSKTISNGVVRYLLTRYAVYIISFLVSLICAAKMGPYYYGIWGYILLLLGYFNRVNFGLHNATTILMVERKKDENSFFQIESSSIMAVGIMSFAVLGIALFHYFIGFNFNEYPVHNIFYIVCIIAILDYFNLLFLSIYRIKHSITEISFYQSVVPILSFLVLFFAKEEKLLFLFIGVRLVGAVLSCIVFVSRGKVSLRCRPSLRHVCAIYRKGFFIFLYNCAFYFIILSTRTFVSSNYGIRLFGYFTFAYALADAVIKLLEAFSFLIFPKLIDKFNNKDVIQVENTLKLLRTNYIALSHGMMYLAFCAFPIITMLFPKYHDALRALYTIALTLIVFTNSYGYSTYLMAQGKEKLLSVISIFCLVINIFLGFLCTKVFNVEFDFVIFSSMISFLVFALLCVYFGRKQMGCQISFRIAFLEMFPFRLLLPYLVALAVVLSGYLFLVFLPICAFVLLNKSTICEISSTLKRVLYNKNVIEINNIPQ